MSFEIGGKIYNSFSEYTNSEEYNKQYEELIMAKNKYKKEAEAFFNSMSYEDKLKCFLHVVGRIHQSEIVDNGTYRHLIYDVMGFETDSYSLGMDFGLMDLHNSIYTYDELVRNLKNLFEYLNISYEDRLFKNSLDILMYGYQKDLDLKNKQLQLDLF